MQITILGSGYVGLVTGACLAELGHHVTCIDTNEAKIAALSTGKCPIYEPELEGMIQRNVERERLFFTSDLHPSIAGAEIVFIAVGTPTSRRGNGYADMGYIHEAARSIAPYLNRGQVVVTKSTVPVGSAARVERLIRDLNPKADFDFASNPEFLREGAAVHDFMHPDRIVIGGRSERAVDRLKKVYQPLYLLEAPFVVTTPETAELIKYASNAFLATKISFINEMANLCEAVGGDVQDLAKGMGLDKRIGSKFLHAGPGFGGSCFPKDLVALVRMAQEQNSPLRIAESVIEINNAQKARMVRKIQQAVGEEGHGKTIAVLGLTFKPETDDMREAPSLAILSALLDKGFRIKAHDPAGMEEAKKLLPDVTYCPDPYAACDGSDAVCLMTEWNSYRAMDLQRIKSLLKQPIFVDLRNVCRPETMKELGFYYISVGRIPVDGRQ